jgi:hypothetical protein
MTRWSRFCRRRDIEERRRPTDEWKDRLLSGMWLAPLAGLIGYLAIGVALHRGETPWLVIPFWPLFLING